MSVNSLIGENNSIDSEKFQLFLEAYYEWLQTTTITLNDTTGTFVVGEIILGDTSGAIGKVIQVTSTELIVKVSSEIKIFDQYETIVGSTSNASSTVYSIKDNVVRASGNILNYRQIETSIDKYVLYLKNELYPSIPSTYYGDKRLIAKHFKDLFKSKGTEQSYRFLFRLLYDQEIEFYYPGTDLLRVSDGKFEKTQIIRTIASAYGYDLFGNLYARDIFSFLNKTIRGRTTGYLANIVDIKKFFIGSREVAEMTLKLVSGTFAGGEEIYDINDENLFTNIYGIVSQINIIDGGSGYKDGDLITIYGDGSEAQAKVISIKESPISSLKVNSIGHGYQLNTYATINNTDTGGSGLIVQVTEIANTYTVTSGANTYTVGEVSKVSIINRGSGYFRKPVITLQDSTITSLGLLTEKLITISNPGSNYGVGNTLIFTGGSGANAAGRIASVVESTTFDLLFEDGQRMTADGSYYDIIKNEDWNVTGPIQRIELTNFGSGYQTGNLPAITINTTTGAGASLIATNIQGKSANVIVDAANNVTGIGSIRAIQISNFGINYSTANAYANTTGDGNAILTPTISGLGIRDGVWLNDDGKIDYKKIQDSYYYQDYSYVIKSGLTFQSYADTLKQIVHPTGLQFFGEIQIFNAIDLQSDLVNELQKYKVTFAGSSISVGVIHLDSQIRWVFRIEEPTATNVVTGKANGLMTLFTGPSYPSTSVSDPSKHEYKLINHAKRIVQTQNVLIDDWNDLTISDRENTTFDLFFVNKDTLIDANVTASVSRSSAQYSEKFSGNNSTIGLHRVIFEDLHVGVIQDVKLSDYTAQSAYEGTPINYYDSNFKDIYINYQKTYTRLIKTFSPDLADTTIKSAQEYKLINHAKRLVQTQNVVIEDWEDLTVSSRQDTTFDLFFVDRNTSIDANAAASFSRSNATKFEKFSGKNSTIGLHRVFFEDLHVGAIQDVKLSDYTAQSAYEETPITCYDSNFKDIYINYQKTYTRLIKTFSTDLADTTIKSAQEYKLINHAKRLVLYQEKFLDEFANVEISLIGNNIFEECLIKPENLSDMNLVVTPIADRNYTLKVNTRTNITPLYEKIIKDVALSEVEVKRFTDLLPQSIYEVTSPTFEISDFNVLYSNYPTIVNKVTKTRITDITDSTTVTSNTAIVVSFEGNGFRDRIYDEEILNDYASLPISSLSDIQFDIYKNTVYDKTIKASPSPLSSGQSNPPRNSNRTNPTDVFRDEIVIKSQSSKSAYATNYGDVKISTISNLTFNISNLTPNDIIPGTQDIFSLQTFDKTYAQAPVTSGTYITYKNINGTVSSSNISYSQIPILLYKLIPIKNIRYKSCSKTASILAGSGTDFVTNFNLSDVVSANNEYFKTESIGNTTYMVVDRLPINSFSGVNAYKVI